MRYSGMIGVLRFMARYFTMLFIFHNYWQKDTVSMRESLLIKELMKKLFVWSLFKIEIKDDDKFIYINRHRGSADIMRLDNRTAYGKPYYPWVLMITGTIMWVILMGISLI